MNSSKEVHQLGRAIWALDLYPTAKSLLMRLLTQGCNWATATSRDTNAILAESLGVTIRTVRYAFGKLRAACLVERSCGSGRAWTTTLQVQAIYNASNYAKPKHKTTAKDERNAETPSHQVKAPRTTATAATEIWNQHPLLPKRGGTADPGTPWPRGPLEMSPTMLYASMDMYLYYCRSGDANWEPCHVSIQRFQAQADPILQWLTEKNRGSVPNMGRQLRKPKLQGYQPEPLENQVRKRRRSDRIYPFLADWLKPHYLSEEWVQKYEQLLEQKGTRAPPWLYPLDPDRWGHLPIWQGQSNA